MPVCGAFGSASGHRKLERSNREYREGVLDPKATPTKLHSIIQRVLNTALTIKRAPHTVQFSGQA